MICGDALVELQALLLQQTQHGLEEGFHTVTMVLVFPVTAPAYFVSLSLSRALHADLLLWSDSCSAEATAHPSREVKIRGVDTLTDADSSSSTWRTFTT